MGIHVRSLFLIGFLLPASPSFSQGPPKDTTAEEFFETRVRPVLVKNCFACHTASKMGGLQLDSREHLLAGGKDGPVIVPGDPGKSVLIQAVRQTHERFKMPPSARLPDETIDDLSAWVKSGAVWPADAATVTQPVAQAAEYVIRPDQRAFWAFQQVHKPEIPKVKNTTWPHGDIDRFILAKLEEKHLQPVSPADRRTLIRRATFDLIGLPPTPEEVDAFLSDKSPNAFAEVVDRLLASPHYGERWGRHWLDYARYADEKYKRGDAAYPNAFRYRDWIIQAFNDDLPYDLFIKAQLAADLLPAENRDKLLPALGFHGLWWAPKADDRVDVTTRTFLGLTVACARCHDHKFDPIPTRDFYSLQGVFENTENYEIPLAPRATVDAYQKVKKQIDDEKSDISEFIEKQSTELSNLLATKTSRYMLVAWKVINGAVPDAKTAAAQANLDCEILERWIKYLKNPEKEHPFLNTWYQALQHGGSEGDVKKAAQDFQAQVNAIFAEQRRIQDRNYVKLGGAEGAKQAEKRETTSLESLEIKKYYLWRDLASEPYAREGKKFDGGVYYFGPKQIDRWLSGEWKEHLDAMRSRLASLEKSLPPQYPFLHAVKDSDHPADIRVHIRGEETNLGEEAPRRFLQILCESSPKRFTKGSGRLELAEAIASPANPLTARVMVNRIWAFHFGQGIVRTLSNFGQLGDRPSHPELLDYLASRFVENHWSIKALHREIMLSAAYQLSTDDAAPNIAQDPANRLIWRANLVPRLDAEALRDAILAVSGELDLRVGGPASRLTADNKRRTVYGYVNRNKLDPTLELFDFPNPNNTIERRSVTLGPLQRLFFMNSSFIAQRSRALVQRLKQEAPGGDESMVIRAYRLLYGRAPTKSEIELGLEFLRKGDGAWPRYAQVLLSSSEFITVN